MKSITVFVLKTVLLLGVLSWLPQAGLCQEEGENAKAGTAEATPDFTQFSLEELKNVVIVSASKKPEKLADAAAAVYVITRDEIRRSGVTSIPEALRLAPGVHVARITATDWAVNIRGLNGQFAKNLLVMIDGRSVYTHLFSGVFWDIQDTVLEDIDRIEVIRGPGATLWGANAVNGVINIITRQAGQTQGWHAVVLGGSEEQSASLRYGGALESGAHYRVYGKFFNRGDLSEVAADRTGDTSDPNNAQASSDWRSGRGGFRLDLAPGAGLPDDSADTFTLQGEAYSNRYDSKFERSSIIFTGTAVNPNGQDDTSRASGWFLLGRWQHTLGADADFTLQLYHDKNQKDYDPGSGEVQTTDLDFQHRLTLGARHEVVWGLEYRYISDKFDDSLNIRMDPSHLDQGQWSTFVQDEFKWVPDRLTVIAGSKFEYNEFTGLELQPSLRTLYTPDGRYSAWAAVSRAVRVPSRLELHGRTSDLVDLPAVDPDNPVEVTTRGNSALEAEELTAYELGLRLRPTTAIWIDTALFYNTYRNLIRLELIGTSMAGDRYDLGYDNNTTGEAYGFETAADWKVSDGWLLGASYTYLQTHIGTNRIDNPEIADLISEESNPRHLWALRSNLDITPGIDFDLWLRYVGRLPEREIDSYTVLDARLAWRPLAGLELSVVGQNLLEGGHSEFSTLEVERSLYAKIDWKF